MGLLKAIGRAFVEEIPPENDEDLVETEVFYEEEVVEAELASVDTNTLIEDIYTQNDLLDKSRSIFKVEELITSLPKEMVTETKRASVLAILSSFNLTALEVSEDGEQRIQVLNAIKEQINADCKNTVINKETQIEELKKSIETLTIEIANEQEKMKFSNETISNEVAKIDNLVKFIGGVN